MANSSNWGGARRGSGRKKKGQAKKPPTTSTIAPPAAGGQRQPTPSTRQTQTEQQQENEFQDFLGGLARLAEEAEERVRADGGGEEDPDDDWSDDEDDDDDGDYEPGSDPDGGSDDDSTAGLDNAMRKKRNSAQYKPPRNSYVDQFLTAKNIEIGRDPKAKNGRHWYFPEEDPVSITINKAPEPEDWYRANIRCYNWCPFGQYCGLVGNLQTDYNCIHCKSKGLVSNGYYWRYAFDFNGNLWLRHRRLECQKKKGGCGRTFAEIDPRFLEQLPLRVVETLPFLTRAKGPCMSANLIYAFMTLATKGILYGSFCVMFNELRYIGHSCDHLGYLEALSDRLMTGLGALGFMLRGPKKVFAPFKSAGEYNGLEMQPKHVRYYFLQVSKVLEPYRQTSLQKDVDEGASPDHTHKFASNIKIPGRPGTALSASYTVMSLNGLVNMSALTHTKSNAEIDDLVLGYRKVRENAGEPKLLRLECDGGGDRQLWKKHFPELKDGTVPFIPSPAEALAEAGISEDQFQFFDTRATANDWARAIYHDIVEHKDKILIVFDLEWPIPTERGMETETRTCQALVYNERTKETLIAVLDLWAMGANDRDSFPKSFRDLLLYPDATLIAHNPGNDVKRLARLGVSLTAWIDVRQLAQQLPKNQPESGTGLRSLAAQYLGLDVNKCNQRADWTLQPLPAPLVAYAALDTMVTLKLYHELSAIINDEGSTFATGNRSQSGLRAGVTAFLKHGRKKVAIVEIVNVGGLQGRQYKWGTLTIGKGKAVVRLKEVLVSGARAPFKFSPSPDQRDKGVRGWGSKKHRKKLVEILELPQEPLIAVAQSSLQVTVSAPSNLEITVNTPGETRARTPQAAPEEPNVGPREMAAASEEPDVQMQDTDALTEQTSEARASVVANMTCESTSEEPPDGPVGNARTETSINSEQQQDQDIHDIIFESDEEYGTTIDEPLRSRDKDDIFHVFQELPLGRKCPARPTISRLLIHATFQFDAEDFDNITRVLAMKYDIRIRVAILRHFYHNREWWRQRCKMYTPTAAEHGNLIDAVHLYVQEDESLRKYYTDELQTYFVALAQACREGQFEELPDVSLYQYNGVDSDGLTLYLRKRGSTKAENFHQKLSAAFGPWSIGAQTGHYLMLLVAYRYNVQTAIRRCNAHNFGHTHLHLVDRIDLLLQEIYGVRVYTRHFNVLLFDGVKDFVCAGITPLTCDERFVKRGPPDLRLRGDKKFMAEKQKVQCSPSPVATRAERKMFNDFLRRNPKLTKKKLEELSLQFLEKTDCNEIFPKLPSHLTSYLKTHRESHMYRQFETSLGEGFNSLLERLANPVLRNDQQVEEPRLAAAQPIGNQRQTAESTTTETRASQLAVPAHVAPAVAPGQSQPIGTSSNTGKRYRCYYWPRCKEWRDVCGGVAADRCSEVQSGRVLKPTPEQLHHEKQAARNREKREKKAEQQRSKKRQRESG